MFCGQSQSYPPGPGVSVWLMHSQVTADAGNISLYGLDTQELSTATADSFLLQTWVSLCSTGGIAQAPFTHAWLELMPFLGGATLHQ